MNDAEQTEREQELQARVDELQQQLDAANEAAAAREADTAAASKPSAPAELAPGHVELNAGDPCPLCKTGRLFKIAEAVGSVTLRCFNCNRQASHNPDVGHKPVVTGPRETPTGFTLSTAQYAARDAEDPEEAAAVALTTEQGSGVSAPRGGG